MSCGGIKMTSLYLTSRGGSQEDQPHVQGAMAAQAQEGLEELFHVQGQDGQQ